MISNASNYIEESTPILIFHQLRNTNSKITCFRRPNLRSIPKFKEVYGLNSILSCIIKKEKPELIENKAIESGIKFFNIPFRKAKKNFLEKDATMKMLIEEIRRMYENLINETLCLLVHCAAGVRRTGIIVYCLLRMNGESRESALEILLKLREETRNGIGDYRIEYAEKYLIPFLLQ
jgi:protein tyrosine/serine phosphatase